METRLGHQTDWQTYQSVYTSWTSRRQRLSTKITWWQLTRHRDSGDSLTRTNSYCYIEALLTRTAIDF